MNVMIYLEKQADVGETCLLLQQAGCTNLETKPDEEMVLGQIDSRQADQLLKVKGVSHMRKGVYVQPPFLKEEFYPVASSVLPGMSKKPSGITTKPSGITKTPKKDEKPRKKKKE